MVTHMGRDVFEESAKPLHLHK